MSHNEITKSNREKPEKGVTAVTRADKKDKKAVSSPDSTADSKLIATSPLLTDGQDKGLEVPRALSDRQKLALEALEANLGNVAAACRAVNRSRQTFYRWKEESEGFAEAVEEVQEEIIDIAENHLLQAIKNGNIIATIFFLKCRAKSRGYIESPLHGLEETDPDEIRIIG